MSSPAFETLGAKVVAACPTVERKTTENGEPYLLVPPGALLAVARLLRDDPELAFDSLMDLTGYDLLRYPVTPASDAICVVLLLHSMRRREKVMLHVHAPRAHCEVPSVGAIWPAALYFEREVYDLLGVTFTGHPSLKRIMTPDDWVGHPLRKDYLYPAEYQGVTHLREGQRFEDGPRRVGDPEPAKPVSPAAKPHGGAHA